MTKKNLLLTINTLSKAGAETVFLTLLNYFPKEEYNIDVLVMLGQGELIEQLPGHINLLNKKYSTDSLLSASGQKYLKKTCVKSLVKHANVLRFLPYLVSNYRDMKKRGKVLKDKLMWQIIADAAPRCDKEYDLAISYIEGASTYYVSKFVKAKKKVAFVHIDYEVAGYTRKLDRDAYLDFDYVFTVSDQGRDKFIEAYPEFEGRSSLFHNPINGELVKMQSVASGGFESQYDGLRLLTIGRLHYQKGYDIAVDAAKILKNKGIEFKWHVLGDGPLLDELLTQVRENDLADNFIFEGAKSNPYPYLRECNIYVQPSRFEGRSVAIQEAMVLGKPIVATNCSGNSEQITSGTDGILCEMTKDAIANAIIDLNNDAELRAKLEKNAKERPYVYEDDLKLLMSFAR